MANGEAPPSESQEPAPPAARPRGRPWLWAGVGALVVAAIVGVAIGVSLGQRQGGPLSGQGGPGGRPTIVVATVAASPSVIAAAPSPSAVVAEASATAAPQAATEYVVQPGDTLQAIAQREYGDAGQWTRIYDSNRDAIGPNPDNLQPGTKLELPPG